MTPLSSGTYTTPTSISEDSDPKSSSKLEISAQKEPLGRNDGQQGPISKILGSEYPLSDNYNQQASSTGGNYDQNLSDETTMLQTPSTSSTEVTTPIQIHSIQMLSSHGYNTLYSTLIVIESINLSLEGSSAKIAGESVTLDFKGTTFTEQITTKLRDSETPTSTAGVGALIMAAFGYTGEEPNTRMVTDSSTKISYTLGPPAMKSSGVRIISSSSIAVESQSVRVPGAFVNSSKQSRSIDYHGTMSWMLVLLYIGGLLIV